jgi:surface protein
VFNQPLGTWDTSAVTSMAEMFSYSAFDQPIGGWNTGAVTDMSSMFANDGNMASGGGVFNQPLATWNTSAVTDMSYMFSAATAFNQPLGTWNTSAVTDMSYMFTGATTLSVANYDADLIGWAPGTHQPGVTLDAPSAHYSSAASAARAVLTGAPNNWVIHDAGLPKPSAPRSVVASPRSKSAVITWAAPVYAGLPVLTKYTVTASPGGRTCTTTGARTCTVTGLANKGVYRFTVKATNKIGTGPASLASAPITVGTATAPRFLSKTFPKAKAVTIKWAAPAFTGSGKITTYQVRWSLNGGITWTTWAKTGLVKAATKTGLINGRKYVVQVRAVNGSGAGLVAALTFIQAK